MRTPCEQPSPHSWLGKLCVLLLLQSTQLLAAEKRQVTIVACPQPDTQDVFLCRRDPTNTAEVPLVQLPGISSKPAVSPDGWWVAFQFYNGEQYYLTVSDTKVPHSWPVQAFDRPFTIQWAADSNWIHIKVQGQPETRRLHAGGGKRH